MSNVFGAYAQYYDILYKDKDYLGESNFVTNLLRKHCPDCCTVLELGCGTGAHAILLAEQGFNMHCVDLSSEMLEVAIQRTVSLPIAHAERLSFSQGDVRDYNYGSQFDAVISLFHVVSYQSTNDSLYEMFQNVARHLKPGGVFIFDYWYGPAVLSERPAVRIKRMNSGVINVTRLATPILDTEASCVDVNYQILVHDIVENRLTELKEIHRLRYLFETEVSMLGKAAGLALVTSGEWLTDKKAGVDTWGVYSVLTKLNG